MERTQLLTGGPESTFLRGVCSLASECTQLCGVRGFEGKASNLGRIQSRGYQPEVVLPARGSLDNVWEHFQLSQPGGERGSGMKLNILQCT